MRLTIAYPDKGTQKVIDIDETTIISCLYDKRIGSDFDGSILGAQFAGYTFRIGGGNDKQGFPMKKGVLTPRRVRLLLKGDTSCFRPRVDGERKRKTVRGSIVSSETQALHLIIVQRADDAAPIPGVSDEEIPRRFGPKRASTIRALHGITDKRADLSGFVLKREVKPGKFTAPKIQRLLTNQRHARKERLKKEREERKKKSAQRLQAYRALTAKA
jgi:small subunit ribosomal protein S6e